MIIFQIIFTIIIISFLVFIIKKKGKKMTKEEKINNIKRFKNAEIYYNNYGELP